MTKKPRKVALPGAPPFYAIKSVDALKADRVNPPETDARVQAILEILKRDFSEPIRVAALARGFGLSASRLQHLFHQHTGQTIKGTVKQIRLDEAVRLLRNPRLALKEICSMVGYCCVSDLARDMKAYLGFSPSELRKRAFTLRH